MAIQSTEFIHLVGAANSPTFWKYPTEDPMLKDFNRWALIDCGCAAYALERSHLLPRLLQYFESGRMIKLPEGTKPRGKYINIYARINLPQSTKE